MQLTNDVVPVRMSGAFIKYAAVIIAVISVALADACIKRATADGSFTKALHSPFMAVALLLYLVQIAFFTYVFAAGWRLSIVGSLQTVFYVLTIVAVGALAYHEVLRPLQWVGIAMALLAVFFIGH